MHLSPQNLYQDININVANWSCSSYCDFYLKTKKSNKQTNINPGKVMDWHFLCNFAKFKFSSRNLCKIRTAWFGSVYAHSLASKVFFPPNPQHCVCLQLCGSCVNLCVCVCTSMDTEAENQFFIANILMESAHSEHQTTLWKQRSLFILSYSIFLLFIR